jgi:hypothetical protein
MLKRFSFLVFAMAASVAALYCVAWCFGLPKHVPTFAPYTALGFFFGTMSVVLTLAFAEEEPSSRFMITCFMMLGSGFFLRMAVPTHIFPKSYIMFVLLVGAFSGLAVRQMIRVVLARRLHRAH